MALYKKRIPPEIVGWETNPETGAEYPVDKDGKIVPEGYFLNILPYYRNPFEDDGTVKSKLAPYIYVFPFALAGGLLTYCNGGG